MATPTTIANRAMLALGQTPNIVDLDAEAASNPNAQSLKAAMDNLRPEMIAEHPWNFAKRTVSQAQDATATVSTFNASTTLPGDCLRVYCLGTGTLSDLALPFEVKEGHLCCDAAALAEIQFTYLVDITDASKFSAGFANALADAMARDSCIALTGNRNLRDDLAGKAERSVLRARGTDAQESGRQTPDTTEFADARYGA